MLLVFTGRHEMVEFAASQFITNTVELGVYEGEFSEHCYKTLHPQRMTLIDFWDYDEYSFVLEDAPQMREVRSIYSGYFRDDPRVVLQAAYQKTRDRFAKAPNVELLKMDIARAADRFVDESLDFIYLDGNHTYEFVLRDLYTWFPKLRSGGLFVCNDFFEAPNAARHNIGVIPAFQTFSKRYPAYPIAVSASEYSDFYFSNTPSSPLITSFKERICASQFPVVELPNELLGNYHHDRTEQPGQPVRLIPTFLARSGS